MSDIPAQFQDAKDILSADGFAVGDVWYHGTSSALWTSIKENGLNRSGDRDLNQKANHTMATIGSDYKEGVQPVFLTQSKELAYLWAEKTVKRRSVRFEGDEMPIVVVIKLTDDLKDRVKPDVGAAAMFMVEGDNYLEQLAEIYKANGLEPFELDPIRADRMDYLNKLGMAYFDQNVPAECIELVSE
jgi:hypothetical protein